MGLVVVLLLLLQYSLGLADVLLLAPVWMQITHLLGADLLWIALVVLTARVSVGGASRTTPLSLAAWHTRIGRSAAKSPKIFVTVIRHAVGPVNTIEADDPTGLAGPLPCSLP